MRAFVFLGGEGPRASGCLGLRTGDLLVAADSGLDLAHRLGVVPDHIVGDFDSVSRVSLVDEYPRARVHRFPADKDYTDAELGVKKARELGAQEIVLVGGGGGRVDHLLGLVALFERPDAPTRWITDAAEMVMIDGSVTVHGRVGELVSLFPLGERQCRMRSRGLKWSLDTMTWSHGDAGISNEFHDEEIRVDMIEGRLLMVLPERAC